MSLERHADPENGNSYVFRVNTIWTVVLAILLAALTFGAPYVFGLPALNQRVVTLEQCQEKLEVQMQGLNDTLSATNQLLARMDERLKNMNGGR
jgi:hypothetical protein